MNHPWSEDTMQLNNPYPKDISKLLILSLNCLLDDIGQLLFHQASLLYILRTTRAWSWNGRYELWQRWFRLGTIDPM